MRASWMVGNVRELINKDTKYMMIQPLNGYSTLIKESTLGCISTRQRAGDHGEEGVWIDPGVRQINN